jgi:putative tryptophan/tyrosine transport system substrate-binding protein
VHVVPRPAAAQGGKPPRVGILSAGQLRSSPLYQAFDQRLRELGYVDGQNIVTDFRSAEGDPGRLPGLAAELAQLRPDVLVAAGPEASVRAARQALGAVPIVIVAVDYDPIATGHVAGLPRPGGTITGVVFRQPELSAKRLELLREALPRVTHIGVLWDAFAVDQVKAAEAVSRSLGVQLHPFEVKSPAYDFEGALAATARSRVGALFVVTTPVIFRERARVASLALKHRLPGMFATREFAEAGGLLAYGADLNAMFAGAAVYVDKILKGARPAELPIEQPTQFQLVVNLKTARALRVTVPHSLVVRADLVIQ